MSDGFPAYPAAALHPGQVTGNLGNLLCCSMVAAKYAAKVLDPNSKLLLALPPQLLKQLLVSEQLQLFSPRISKLIENQEQLQQTSGPSPGSVRRPSSRADKQKSSPASAAKQQRQGKGADSKLYGQHRHQLLPAWGFAKYSSSKGTQAAAQTFMNSSSSWGSGPIGKGASCQSIGSVQHIGSSSGAASSASRRQSNGAGSLWAALKAPKSSCSSFGNKHLHNREKARDLFFAAVKQSSAGAIAVRHAWEQEQHQQAVGEQGVQQNVHGNAGAQYALQLLAKLLCDLHQVMQELLQQLQPGSLTYVCELFTSCVLQAISTGEHVVITLRKYH